MRLFIALDLSKEAEEELRRLQNDLLNENMICSKTEEFHVTLKFFGDVKEDKARDVIDALKRIGVSPLKLRLSNIGVFPDENYIRVVWVGLKENDELISLHKNINEALNPFNFKDDFSFHPHLTLARVKHIGDKKAFIDKMRKTTVKPIEFGAESFVLYKSTLTPQGPVYEKVEEFS